MNFEDTKREIAGVLIFDCVLNVLHVRTRPETETQFWKFLLATAIFFGVEENVNRTFSGINQMVQK